MRMRRVLILAGFGVGVLLSLATAAPAAAQAASDPGQPAAQADAPGEIGVICLSNACMKAAPSEPRRDAAAAARAIEAGDVSKVMLAGGTPEDVIAAMRTRLSQDPDAIFNPESPRPVPLSRWMDGIAESYGDGEIPRLVQYNGRNSLAFFTPSGRLAAVTTIPGMNGPGIAPRGEVYNVPPPVPPPPPPPPPAELLRQWSGQ